MMVPVGSATRFISRCRVPAFRYYRRQFFKPRHTAFDIFVWQARIARPAKKRPDHARRRGCHASPPQIAPLRVLYIRRRARGSKNIPRRGRVKFKKKKKKKRKKSRASRAKRKCECDGGDGSCFRSFGADAWKHLHLAALLCLASRITLYLSVGNLRNAW